MSFSELNQAKSILTIKPWFWLLPCRKTVFKDFWTGIAPKDCIYFEW